MTLREIKLSLLTLPLKAPYHLAFGDVIRFDTVLVEMRDGDGRYGFGEATLLPAYGGESADDAWAFCRTGGDELIGRTTTDAKARLAKSADGHAFSVTALTTAMEMLEGHPVLDAPRETRVPILGGLNATDPVHLAAEVEELLDRGFGTLKVKVGFNLAADLNRVARVQRAVAGRALIRLDGNQGYDVEQACRFAAEVDPQGIELLEQPCPAGDWAAARAVAQVSRVPMMLDESIFGIADIERAADLEAAAFIKLKLMKMGGLDRLIEGLERIRALGMEPVLGNGVASEPGCWMEARVAAGVLRNAGEFNGFLRPVDGIFTEPLAVERGCIVLPAGVAPALDAGRLKTATVATRVFRTTAVPAAFPS